MLTRSPPPRKRRPLQPIFFEPEAQQPEEAGPSTSHNVFEARDSSQKRQRLNTDASEQTGRDQMAYETPMHNSSRLPSNIASTSRALNVIPQNHSTPTWSMTALGRDSIIQRGQEPVASNLHMEQREGLCCTYECTNLVKREFLELLEQQKQALAAFKKELDAERKAREEAESESAALGRKVRDCRAGLASAEAREVELQRFREEEARRGEERWRGELARVSELQRRLDKEVNARLQAEASARASEARATAAETGGDQAAGRAQREIRALKLQLEQTEDENRRAVTKADLELKALRMKVETATAEADAAQASLDETRSALNTAEEHNTSLEKALAEAQSQAVAARSRSNRGHELEVLVGQLQSELAQGAADVAEARRLKDMASKVSVLHERLASAEGRAERAEKTMQEFAAAKEKIAALESEIDTWQQTARRLPGVNSRADLATKFEELQKEALTAKSKEGDFREELARLKIALASAESALREAQSDKAAAEGKADETALALRRAERKAALLMKERDGLKAILASYEEEEALERSERGADATEEARASKAKIQQLETEVAGGRDREKELESNIAEVTDSATQQRQRADRLQAELDGAARRNKGLEREIEQLSREVAMLESKVGKGDYNRATTKVLHLAFNPEVEARRKLAKDSLEGEVEELRAKVKQLEQAARQGSRSPGGEDQQIVETREASAQVAALTSRVNAMEKREARYKQVFADKIGVFRQACAHLFGYVVEMSDTQDAATGALITSFSIRSVYADDEEDRLLFQYRDGAMEMLANDFSRTSDLVRQVKIFLERFKSIPALTANLTVESFNKHTVT